MAGVVATGWTDTAKQELAQGIHDFTPSIATANNVTMTSGNFTLTAINAADIGKFRVGCTVSGTSVASGSVVASIDSATQVTVSKAATGSTSNTVTIGGDTFAILLVKAAASLSQDFDRDQTNVGTPGTGAASLTNVGTDEVANGSGYTSGGQAVAMETGAPKLTAASGAYWNLSTNPNWTTATFTSRGAVVYSTRAKQGHSNGITANASGSALNKALACFNFTTDQSVSNGTFTLTMPTSSFAAAMFAIG
jgi:hypothetical protein